LETLEQLLEGGPAMRDHWLHRGSQDLLPNFSRAGKKKGAKRFR